MFLNVSISSATSSLYLLAVLGESIGILDKEVH